MEGAFHNRMAEANDVTKNIKIKIRRGLRWLQNDVRNATINQKRAASIYGRWDVMSERQWAQGEHDLIVLGVIELGGGEERWVKSIKLLNYFFSWPIYKMK